MATRRRLRTRLLVAMLAIALGTLVVTAAVTAGLARRNSADSARDNLADHTPVVADELDQLITLIPKARPANETVAGRRQIRRTRALLQTTLSVSDGAVVGIHPDGSVHELLAGLLGAEETTPQLPNGVDANDLDTAALLDGTTQKGRDGDTVFQAQPLNKVGDVTPVVVLAEQVNTRPFGQSSGLVLGAAVLALVVAALVAAFLARRLTRPLAAMEATAGAIAAGDLSARVDTEHVADDELGSLARAINVMAEELDASRGHERAFLLSVSHDLRTPLTSIRGYAEAMLDGTVDDDESRLRAAEVIASESRRLERLVADLLDLARLDTHQFSLRPQPVDARVVVSEAVDAFRPAATDLGLALVSTGSDGAPVPATLDPQRLAQIVANLMENALKYASTTVTTAVRADGERVVVTVDDDGPGIAPADLPHVFDRLYTSRTVPGRVVGTGIGLAIVHELAAAMGGEAHVEPVDTVGTRFVVSFPAGAAPAPVATTGPPAASPAS
ncbi:MAG TPA: HAMP domain-containing sensor histidine kinase [Acidimicrobiia bacterium]